MLTLPVVPPKKWLQWLAEDGCIDLNDVRGILWTLLYSDDTNVENYRELCGYICSDIPDTIEDIREKIRLEKIPKLVKRGWFTKEFADMLLDPGSHGVVLV